MQRNWLTTVKAKEAEATKQTPTPTQPTTASVAVQAAQYPATQSSDIQFPKYCAICSPLRKLCLSEYPITADWPDDSAEGKETQEQNKAKDNFFSDIEYWDGDLYE